jgi:hypothetical protein
MLSFIHDFARGSETNYPLRMLGQKIYLQREHGRYALPPDAKKTIYPRSCGRMGDIHCLLNAKNTRVITDVAGGSEGSPAQEQAALPGGWAGPRQRPSPSQSGSAAVPSIPLHMPCLWSWIPPKMLYP